MTPPEDAEDSVAALRALPFTYPERGWTAWDRPPAGYHAIQRSAVVGRGRAAFESAADDLMSWRVHRRAGLRLVATDRVAVVGARVLLRVGFGPFTATAPCQVVWTLQEENRRGFAYGTLVGHPESGEESFTVTLTDDGRVIFTVRAFSRPATLLARLGGPVATLVQGIITRRYLTAARVRS